MSEPELVDLFGQERGPAAIQPNEEVTKIGFVPSLLKGELSPLVEETEWPALLERAPLDLRVNISRATRRDMLEQFPGGEPTPLSPWGIRLRSDTHIADHPCYRAGLVEVQDEGSQLVALACDPRDGMTIIDLCAGAGGKSLALAAAAPAATLIATDSNRTRLSRLAPRSERAGAKIEARVVDPPDELTQLSDWQDKADLVLVDAPCSGTGTWRRNPETRWRITPERLNRLVAAQAHLLDVAARLARPGGTIVYAVCSILSREGAGQIQHFLHEHSSWIREETPIAAGRLDGCGRLLTPGHDRTDGFFVARLRRQ